MAPDEKVVVTLDDFEQRLLVSGLADFRNDLIRDEKPTEDVDDLILKVIEIKWIFILVIRRDFIIYKIIKQFVRMLWFIFIDNLHMRTFR